MDRQPKKIEVRGAKVHNLKNIDVDIPLNQMVAIVGKSGSGKSSLAMGVLYAEGSRRYLDSLSTYTRRRMTSQTKAEVDEVRYVPAALALHQRPSIPGLRSTFGTGSELLNHLRLMYSRLASYCCENGHYIEPSLELARGQECTCPICKQKIKPLSAEQFAFNSQGACLKCGGTGIVRTVNIDSLVPDPTLTIDQGAVAPWNSLMWTLMSDVCRAMGVRTDVPFEQLTDQEKQIVYYGPAQKKHIFYKAKNTDHAGEMDFTYYNATYTVENALAKVKDDKGMKRVEKFLKEETCPECHGTRLSNQARLPILNGLHLHEACALTLSELIVWVQKIPESLPERMKPMAKELVEAFLESSKRLMDLGLGYLSLDRSTSSLSTGERQRMQLARAVRNRTTGILYVLDEPSIGLHPSNIYGLKGVMEDLLQDGNSVLFVDHDLQMIKEASWLIEMGPEAGKNGGYVIGEGTVEDLKKNSHSIIAPFLAENYNLRIRPMIQQEQLFNQGKIHLQTNAIHTVKPLDVEIPKGRLTVVTGLSGSGKTTLVLECLLAGMEAKLSKTDLPKQVRSIEMEGIEQVKLIDASPIGINVRSTVATYINVHDELRKYFSKTSLAKQKGYKAGDFSYNTGKLRCPTCDGTGILSLDVQFLPDVQMVCPDCLGSRYALECNAIHAFTSSNQSYSLPELMNMDVSSALKACEDLKSVTRKLSILEQLGLGYLTLGEQTPSLSGGEAQRLKLASEMSRSQVSSLFIFDEPTIGLHPLDVQTLLGVFQTLIEHGATIVVIEHDLDVIKNADYIIDMGPGGGQDGGQIVAKGSVEQIKKNARSITGHYL